MAKYAQILNNKAHWIFESDAEPQFAPDIVIVEITPGMGDVQEGWDYDEVSQKFPPPEPQPIPVPKASIEEIAEETLLETKYQTSILEMMM